MSAPPIIKSDKVVPIRRTQPVEIAIYVNGTLGRTFTLDEDETREFVFASGMEGVALDRTDDGAFWHLIPWAEIE